jgi:hypothetical protein
MTERRFWFSRTFWIVSGSLALLLVAAYLWGFQTIMAVEFRYVTKKAPILWKTPQPLQDLTVSQAEGAKLSHVGFEFEVPWDDLNAEQVMRKDNIAVFIFRSGIGISFFGPGKDLISIIKTQAPSREATAGLEQLLGESATQSDYALRNAILEASPEMLRPWIPRREAIRIGTFLSIKGSIDSGHGGTGIFRIGANGWKGFQFDDPAQKPDRVQVDLYDSQDHHIMMIFQSKKDAKKEITQADVNRAIETLKTLAPDISK